MSSPPPPLPEFEGDAYTPGTPHVPEDVALFARIRDGDEYAFNTLVRKYAESLYRFAYLRTRERHLAEDVVQDVFAHLWERRGQLDIRDNIKGYLFRSVGNRALDVLRHQRSQRRIEDLIGQGIDASQTMSLNEGDETLEREELARVTRNALVALPNRTREIFMLRREQGMSYGEIAETLGIGVPTVRNQMSRAVQAIQHAFRRWQDGR